MNAAHRIDPASGPLGMRTMRWLAIAALVAVTGLATGCATTRQAGDANAGDRADPIESVNRVVYRFNDTVDKAVFKPIAQGYKYVLPTQLRYCVSNAFGNIADVPTSLNNFLQGKFREGGSDLCRVAINSTVGFVGCFDIASRWGFEKHNEDFGQTLGRWGVPSGPYVVLPLLGPSTLRDSLALLVDSQADPVRYINVPPRNIAYGVRVVDRRAQLLDTSNLLEDAALDPYVFIRDAYLTRRQSLVDDGHSPGATDIQGGDATSPAQGTSPAEPK